MFAELHITRHIARHTKPGEPCRQNVALAGVKSLDKADVVEVSGCFKSK